MNNYEGKIMEKQATRLSANAFPMELVHSEPSAQLADHRPQMVTQRKMQEMADNSWQVKQQKTFQNMAQNRSGSGNAVQLKAGAGVVQRQEGENGEGEKESWGSWLWRHKWKLAIAGVGMAGAYYLYQKSGGSDGPDVSKAAEGASSVASSTPAPDAVAGAGGNEEGIFFMSLRQAISGPKPGDLAPPCPLDPLTGGPNLDAWGELIEKAVTPLIEKGMEMGSK